MHLLFRKTRTIIVSRRSSPRCYNCRVHMKHLGKSDGFNWFGCPRCHRAIAKAS